MESFFSSLKTERTGRKTHRTRDEARADVFDYIERFYNPKRSHSTIGYTPATSRVSLNLEPAASAKRLMTVPGIGPIISTATVAAIGSGDAFSKGRDFSAWLGLVPRQMSTGGRTILGPISKRGNRYLRMLFVQAARAVLLRPQNWEKHGLKSWIEAAARRLNRFKLAIALANKIARIVWGVLHGGRNFEIRQMKPAPQAA
jgi:transposase